jgi:quercetin dioxygenase-like cupin family protein
MRPRVGAPGEGEVVTDRPGRRLVIRLATPALVLTESRYGAGERGASPHIHKAHTDCFRVLSGAIRFGVGAEEVVVGAGGLAVIPPGVVHSFDNGADAEVHFLNFHVPNTGFDTYLREIKGAASEEDKRELNERTDSWDPPADGGRPATDALLRTADELLAQPAATPDICVSEVVAGPGFEVPAAHAVVVLEGTLELDGETLETGAAAVVDGGFVQGGDATARLLVIA